MDGAHLTCKCMHVLTAPSRRMLRPPCTKKRVVIQWPGRMHMCDAHTRANALHPQTGACALHSKQSVHSAHMHAHVLHTHTHTRARTTIHQFNCKADKAADINKPEGINHNWLQHAPSRKLGCLLAARVAAQRPSTINLFMGLCPICAETDPAAAARWLWPCIPQKRHICSIAPDGH